MTSRNGTKPTLKDWHLWHRVAQDIKPFQSREKNKSHLDDFMKGLETTTSLSSKPHQKQKTVPSALGPKKISTLHDSYVPDRLDNKLRKNLSKEKVKIDARLDLHGMTQSQAYDRLVQFISNSQTKGLKIVLVITGKGLASLRESRYDPAGLIEAPGILKRKLPQWLHTDPLKQRILSFETAHRKHGGEGATYIRLRKQNKKGSSP
jgi:DNA-nicking Smr family endonuclease